MRVHIIELIEFSMKVASSTLEEIASDTLHYLTVVDLWCQFDHKLQDDFEFYDAWL